MAYEAKTRNDLAKWWIVGTGSVVNRLSEVMDDFPLGPAIFYTTGWTAAGNEYYITQATANDSAAEKIGAGAWAALVLGAGIGLLNAGEYFHDAATTRLYVRLTGSVAPSATNQVRAHYLWDGSGAGPAIMTEVIEDSDYKIDLPFDVGDTSTVTTLESALERITMNGLFYIKNNATFQCGALTAAGRGKNGSQFVLKTTYQASDIIIASGATNATFKFYASTFVTNSWPSFNDGTIDIRDSTINGDGADIRISFSVQVDSLILTNVLLTKIGRLTTDVAATINTFILNDSYLTISADITIEGVSVIGTSGLRVDSDNTATFLDPIGTITQSMITNVNGNSVGKLTYSVNLLVKDPLGNALSGAVALLEGSEVGAASYDTQQFSVSTATDGTITEQTPTIKKWVGTSETETDYNVHRLTLTKAGYETLIIENITIDGPIDWELEMQPMRSRNLGRSRRGSFPNFM